MNSNETNGSRIAPAQIEESLEGPTTEFPRQRPPLPAEPALTEARADAPQSEAHATREGINGKAGIEKSKLIMLGGGLLVAVLFFAVTSLVNHSSSMQKANGKKANNQAQQQAPGQSKGNLRKKRWAQLDREVKARFWNYSLIVEMLPDVTDSSVKNIFERINRNSRRLSILDQT